MPNWCYNKVTFQFLTKELYEKFLEAVRSNQMIRTFMPLQSESFLTLTAAEMWGTKWDPSHIHCNEHPDILTLVCSFESAWSPPDKFYKFMNKTYNVQIEAFFNEPDMAYFGMHVHTDSLNLCQEFHYPKRKEDIVDLQKVMHPNLFTYMEPEFQMHFAIFDTILEARAKATANANAPATYK